MDRDEKLEFITRLFYRKVTPNLWFKVLNEHVGEQDVILEVGSGSGKGLQNRMYPKAKEVFGIDLDPRVLQNPYLSKAACGSAYDIADIFKKQQFKCIYSHMVAEHIDDAEKFLTAQLAVLEANGSLIHSTVSKHYWTSMINNFVPTPVKNWLVKNIGSGRPGEDIFPACYNLNSPSQLFELSRKLEIDYEIIRQDEPPGYLRRSIVLMLLYTIIHKPLQFLFPCLRPTLIMKIQKKNNNLC